MKVGIIILSSLICFSLFQVGNQNPQFDDVKLHRFIPTECNNLSAYRLVNRIISRTFSNDSTFLKIGFWENCCLEFKPEVVSENNVLKVILNSDQQTTICECNCCFEVTLVLTGILDAPFRVLFNENEIFLSEDYYNTVPEKFEIIDNDTINRTNKYGHKTGAWKVYNEETGKLERINYYSGLTGNEIIDFMGSDSYYSNGVVSQRYYPDSSLCYYRSNVEDNYLDRLSYGFRQETYYENGQLKSSCIQYCPIGTRNYTDSCTYWNKRGKVVKNLP